MNIAILGAPGCVGMALIRRLLASSGHRVIASYTRDGELSRFPRRERLVPRKVNLLEESSARRFFENAEVLVYLIHSLPRKNFKSLDPQLADAAGKAARESGVKKIIYMSGIIPKGKKLSPHLQSRKETGERLASHGIPVAEVRASILLGVCSVSYQIVYYLSKKHHFIAGPRSLNSYCAPAALSDAVEMLDSLIARPSQTNHEIFEIGSENIRYKDLLVRCGAAIHPSWKNRVILAPFFPIALSAWWTQLSTGIPRRVAQALFRGLKDDTVPAKNRFTEVTGRQPQELQAALNELAREMQAMGQG